MSQIYFYDEQIRRFLLQFTRIFSNFQVEYSRDDSGNKTLMRVPIRYGDGSRNAQIILQNNSANSMPSTPMMTFYITGLEYARNRVQEPYYVDKKVFRQRAWDPSTQTYENTQGTAFTVERPMPVPYTLTINLDIWTSNTNQKFQILEQILPLFNPALEIQSTDNYIDWTSLSVVELVRQTWSSRTVPVGTDEPLDIASLTFTLPIWISPPARVSSMGVVHKVIASMYKSDGDLNDAIANDDLLLGTRQKITPYGYQVILLGNHLQIMQVQDTANLPADDQLVTPIYPPNSPARPNIPTPKATEVKWHKLVDLYGNLRNGVSQIRLVNPVDESEIVGTVAYHPTDDKYLLFSVDVDTLPANTLAPIDAIVNPLVKGPGSGLVAALTGQRYLLVESVGNATNQYPGSAWGGLVAKTNDIIEFDGTNWTVVFESAGVSDFEYVVNQTTDVQYRWDGTMWQRSYEGLYKGGNWSLVI